MHSDLPCRLDLPTQEPLGWGVAPPERGASLTSRLVEASAAPSCPSPWHRPALAAQPGPSRGSGASQANPTQVVVVDHDRKSLGSIERALAGQPGLVLLVGFTSVEQAIRGVDWGSVDVLLTEMDLPGSSAVTLLTTVLRANRSMKAAAHTHNRNPEAMFTALGAGATGYLIKNDRPKLLTDAVRALADGDSPISPAMASHLIRPFVPAKRPVTPDDLSARERQILDMIRAGLIRKEVAARLNLSVHTIHAHMKTIQRKLQATGGPKP